MARPRAPAKPAMLQLGPLIRQMRAEKLMSFDAFVERAGLSRAYLSLLEAGRGNPTLETLLIIAEALDVKPHELLLIY